ncbi:LysR substrate-binding domain-containing protein [Pseudomonas citronellolis]|uniref:LysR substrate-binding domain-containing protein n=1 Tax=Pseudomonas citronellolis TaxID=53408 RepID=UPI0021BE6075|nr:LysR substrate-binding domain-containing protein [Pseudomonas citronellolis]UXJ50867.1 LysR substrate-binding domain-containing protein [Pseudomonas citronellolis]
MIPRLLLAFRNAYPEVKIILHNMNKEAQIEALRQRRIDLGFNRFIKPSMILPANTWPRNNFGLLLISAIRSHNE